MKGLRVGGVHFTVSVNAKGVDEGLSKAETIIKQFQKKMNSIKIDPIFKGESMKRSIDYIKTAQKELDKTYDSWKGRIDGVSRKMGTLKSANSTVAEDVRKRTEKMILQAEKFFNKMDELSEKSSKRVTDRLTEIRNKFMSAAVSGGGTKSGMGLEFSKVFSSSNLGEDLGLLPEEIAERIKRINKLGGKDVDPKDLEGNYKQIYEEVNKLIQEIDKFGEKSEKVKNKYVQGLERIGTALRETMGKNARSLYREQIAKAKSSNRVLQEQEQALASLAIKEAEYRANVREGMEVEKNRSNLIRTLTQQMAIKGELDEKKLLEINKLNLENLTSQEARLRKELELGLNVRKNSAALSQNLNEQRERGRSFTEKEIEANRRLNASIGQSVLTFEERKAVANAGIVALEKNEKAVQDLQVRETELRREIALGINVEKNRAELFSNVNRQKQLNANITKEQVKANERLGLSLGKLTPSYREQLQIAAQTTLAEDRRKAALRELRIEAEKLKAEIAVGMDIDKKKIALYDNLNARMKLGEYVVASEREEWRKLGVELGRTEKSYQELLADARNVTLILEKQEKELKKLTVEETRLRTAIQAGVDVKRNTIALSKNLNRQRELGADFTKEQRKELERLDKSARKMEATGGFGSKKWFMQRATWFIQLRGYWLLYRGAMEAMQGAFQFEQEIVNVKAIAQATTKQFERLKAVALDVGKTTRFSAAEAAQAMVTLAQAGYSTNEILSATQSIAQLATATLYGLKESADLVTSITKAWGKDATETKEIVDTLATSTNVTRLNMSYLGTSMNYVAGIAPQLDLSLKKTLALLGTMANRGMNASIASTALRGVMAELLKPTDRFKTQLARLGVALEDVDPSMNDVADILKTLKNAGWDAENSFRAFERRVAMGATVLIQNANSLDSLSESMHSVDRAAIMAAENLDTVQGQWKQFKDISVAVASGLNDVVEPSLKGLIQIFKGLVVALGLLLSPLVIITGVVGALINKLVIIFSGKSSLINMVKEISKLEDSRKYINSLNNQLNTTINKLYELQDTQIKITKLIKKATDAETGKLRLSIYKKILDLAEEKKLLTENEIALYKETIEDEETREDIVDAINSKLSDRNDLLEKEYTIVEGIKEMEEARQREREKDVLLKAAQEYRKAKLAFDDLYNNLEITRKKAISELAEMTGKTFEEVEKEMRVAGQGSIKDRMNPYRKALERTSKELILAMAGVSEDVINAIAKDVPEILAARMAEETGETITEMMRILELWERLESIGIEIPKSPNLTVKQPTYGTTYETPQQIIQRLSIEKESLGIKIKTLKLTEDALNKEEKISSAHKERLDIINERDRLARSVAKKERDAALERLEIDLKDKEEGEKADRRRLINENYRLALLEQDKKVNNDLIDLNNILGKEAKERLKTENDILGYTIKRNDRVIKELKLGTGIIENEEEINRLQEENNRIQHQILNNKEKILRIDRVTPELIRAMMREEKAATDAATKAEIAKTRMSATEQLIKNIRIEQGAELDKQEIVATKLDETFASTSTKLQHELETLTLKLEQNRRILNIYESQEGVADEILKRKKEEAEIHEEIRKKLREQYLLSKPLLAAYTRIKSSAESMKEAYSRAYESGIKTAISGLGSIITDIGGGFQDIQQQVVDLEGELQNLAVEYENALSEGNVERAAEIKREMAALNDEIKDLKNPLKQTGEMFRQFAKDVVDNIRKIINEWIAMQIVMGIVKMVLPGGGTATESEMTSAALDTGTPMKLGGYDNIFAATAGKKHGGILPKIEAFRSFSTGGLTGRPTMALLGDNQSGRELVIPEENISENKVSGYMRKDDKTPITIINVFTDEDVLNTMSTLKGKRVILNAVGQDMRQGQGTSRRYDV